MSQVNRRSLKDENSAVTAALPAENTDNDTADIKIGGEGPHREGLKLLVEVPATPSLANSQTITFTLQDGASGATATSNPGQTYTITGDGGDGADAVDFYFDIPQGAGEYVSVNQAASSTAGDNTAVTVSYYLVN